jgi:hypothetical protein
MVQGDEFDYLIYYAGVNPAIPVAIINSINLAFNRIATDSQEGLIFNIAKQLPDVTQFDLLNAVMTMHNLYFTTNETAKTVTLSQYDTFIKDDFFANNILDWTNKIAPAKGFEMTFTNQNLARNVYLTYQTADDFLCTLYQDANNQKSWGNYRWQNNNQTGDLEQLVEVPVFASARGSRVPYKAVGNNQLRNRYFVRLWDIDYRNPDNITDFSFQTNWTPRILKYKYFLGIPADPYVGLLRFTYAFGTNSSTTTEEAVAYFELDNPIGRTTPSTPTDSLAFNNSNPNHVGLYERYHVAMYNRIKQSRQLDVYAYLSAADYYAIDFGKPIRINHDLFLLNAVTDWNANGNGLCKLTLIQI